MAGKSSVAEIPLNAEVERVRTDRQSFLEEEAEETMNDIREPWEPLWDVLKGNTDMRRKTYLNLEKTHQTHWIQNREEGLRN